MTGVATAYGEIHTWTNLTAQKFEAEMIGMDVAARAVRVRAATGQIFSIPVAKLSAEDVAYAGAQWRRMQANGGAAPVAPALTGVGGPLPPRFISRCNQQVRLAQITKHGGSDACETAVTKSLQWLKEQQNADGSWGRYTGLVLQCYSGRCEGFESPEYGPTVLKGIEHLIKLGAGNAAGIVAADPKSASAAYEHGMAATALGEAYVLARANSQVPPGLRETFEKAVRAIITAQGTKGSWDYYPAKMLEGEPPSSREDLSVTNWQLQALLVARESGMTVAGLERCLAQAANYLESKQTKDGASAQCPKIIITTNGTCPVEPCWDCRRWRQRTTRVASAKGCAFCGIT